MTKISCCVLHAAFRSMSRHKPMTKEAAFLLASVRAAFGSRDLTITPLHRPARVILSLARYKPTVPSGAVLRHGEAIAAGGQHIGMPRRN